MQNILLCRIKLKMYISLCLNSVLDFIQFRTSRYCDQHDSNSATKKHIEWYKSRLPQNLPSKGIIDNNMTGLKPWIGLTKWNFYFVPMKNETLGRRRSFSSNINEYIMLREIPEQPLKQSYHFDQLYHASVNLIIKWFTVIQFYNNYYLSTDNINRLYYW